VALNLEGQLNVNETKRTWKQRIFHLLKQGVVITCYLFVVFSLFDIHKSVILAEHQINLVEFGLNFINAWALAKVILVGQELNLADHFRDAPLICPTLLKSFVYTVLIACLKILEAAIISRYRSKPFAECMDAFAGGSWKGLLTLTMVLFVVLIPFFAFGELRRVFGEPILGVFLRPRHSLKSACS
jgi:hypothetical protein